MFSRSMSNNLLSGFSVIIAHTLMKELLLSPCTSVRLQWKLMLKWEQSCTDWLLMAQGAFDWSSIKSRLNNECLRHIDVLCLSLRNTSDYGSVESGYPGRCKRSYINRWLTVNHHVSERVFVCFTGTWYWDPLWDAACGDPRCTQREQACHPHLPRCGTEPWVYTKMCVCVLAWQMFQACLQGVSAPIRRDNWPPWHIAPSCLRSSSARGARQRWHDYNDN